MADPNDNNKILTDLKKRLADIDAERAKNVKTFADLLKATENATKALKKETDFLEKKVLEQNKNTQKLQDSLNTAQAKLTKETDLSKKYAEAITKTVENYAEKLDKRAAEYFKSEDQLKRIEKDLNESSGKISSQTKSYIKLFQDIFEKARDPESSTKELKHSLHRLKQLKDGMEEFTKTLDPVEAQALSDSYKEVSDQISKDVKSKARIIGRVKNVVAANSLDLAGVSAAILGANPLAAIVGNFLQNRVNAYREAKTARKKLEMEDQTQRIAAMRMDIEESREKRKELDKDITDSNKRIKMRQDDADQNRKRILRQRQNIEAIERIQSEIGQQGEEELKNEKTRTKKTKSARSSFTGGTFTSSGVGNGETNFKPFADSISKDFSIVHEQLDVLHEAVSETNRILLQQTKVLHDSLKEQKNQAEAAQEANLRAEAGIIEAQRESGGVVSSGGIGAAMGGGLAVSKKDLKQITEEAVDAQTPGLLSNVVATAGGFGLMGLLSKGGGLLMKGGKGLLGGLGGLAMGGLRGLGGMAMGGLTGLGGLLSSGAGSLSAAIANAGGLSGIVTSVIGSTAFIGTLAGAAGLGLGVAYHGVDKSLEALGGVGDVIYDSAANMLTGVSAFGKFITGDFSGGVDRLGESFIGFADQIAGFVPGLGYLTDAIKDSTDNAAYDRAHARAEAKHREIEARVAANNRKRIEAKASGISAPQSISSVIAPAVISNTAPVGLTPPITVSSGPTMPMTGMLGDVSKKYESGKRGAATISSGKGDAGGASYGTYQLSSNRGTLQNFLRSSEYGKEFSGLAPGSKEFNDKWKEVAARDSNFGKAQHDFIQRTHYEPQVQKLAKAGLDFANRGRKVQEALFSTSVQFGGDTGLVINALKGKNASELSDDQIVSAIQDYKIANNDKLFKSSSADVRASTLNRAYNEKRDLLNLPMEQKDLSALNKKSAEINADIQKKQTAKATVAPTIINQDNSNKPIVNQSVSGGGGDMMDSFSRALMQFWKASTI